MAAEIPAGGRPGVVDGTTPLNNPVPVRLILLQVPARSICKKISPLFFQAALPEIMQLVGLTLPDEDKREPAAARTAAAAGTRR